MKLSDFFYQVYSGNQTISDGSKYTYTKAFEQHIKPIFGERILTEISSEEWSRFKAKLLSKGLTKGTANRIHAVGSGIYKLAVKWRYAKYNPLAGVDWYKEDLHGYEFWTIDEAHLFLNWAKTTNCPRFALYQLAYETGLRVSEIIALKRDAVDLVQGNITIRRDHCRKTCTIKQITKSGHIRIIGLNSGLIQTLAEYLKTHNSEFVFPSEEGEYLYYESIRDLFARHQKLAGVKRIKFHSLRHTFASHFVMNGGTIYDLKKILGHSDIETTERYAHLAQEHLKWQSRLVQFQAADPSNVVQFGRGI